jgi:hypothetical protein
LFDAFLNILDFVKNFYVSGSFSNDKKFTQIGIAVFGYVIQLPGLFHS